MGLAQDEPLTVVLAWHEAVNAGDIDAACELADEDIEIAGPRGSTYGIAALRDWVQRAAPTLVPRGAYVREGAVVVAEDATWAADDNDPADPTAVFTAFLVIKGQITRIARHVDLPAALADAAVGVEDTVDLPG